MANLYANGSGSINYSAVGTGSGAGNWYKDADGTPNGAVPGVGDTVLLNNRTITVDVSISIGGYSTAAGTTAVAGGGFTCSASGLTVTVAGTGLCGTTTAFTYTGNSPNTFSFTCGTLQASTSTVGTNYAFNHNGTATITMVVTNITGGSQANTNALGNSTTGTINLTVSGAVTGGSVSTARGIRNAGTGTITGTGNIVAGSLAGATSIDNTSTGIINWTYPSLTGGTVAFLMNNTVGGTVNHTGDITGGNGFPAFQNNGIGPMNVNGNVFGGVGVGGTGVGVSSTGLLTVNGNVSASTNAAGINASNVNALNVCVNGCTIDASNGRRAVSSTFADFSATNTSITVASSTSFPTISGMMTLRPGVVGPREVTYYGDIVAGATGNFLVFQIPSLIDPQGGGLAGLLFNTSGLTFTWRREGEAAGTTFALATTTLGTWVKAGFINDGTSVPGTYELGVPDKCAFSGARWVRLRLFGAANMVSVQFFLRIKVLNDQSATTQQDPTQLIPTNPIANTYAESAFITNNQAGRRGICQAGSTSTSLVLDAGASSDPTAYVGDAVYLMSGTGGGVRGVGQRRYVVAYNSTNKTVTPDRAWGITPDNTTQYLLLPNYIGLDWSKITNPTATVALSGTTVLANLVSILGTALTETVPGYITAAFKKFFNVVTPTSTMNQITLVDTTTNSTNTPTVGDFTATQKASLASASAGSGAFSATITVNDGVNPIQNATVTLTINASVYTVVTNSSGVAVLTPTEGNGTYGVAIRAVGYSFTPTTLVISGNTSHTYSMTAITISPSTPPFVTGWLIALDGSGNPQAKVSFTLKQTGAPVGGLGSGFNADPITVFSASNGLVQFSMAQSAPFTIQRENGPAVRFTSDTVTFEMPSVIG